MRINRLFLKVDTPSGIRSEKERRRRRRRRKRKTINQRVRVTHFKGALRYSPMCSFVYNV